MRILVVGGGSREHALIWKLVQSPKVKKIYVAPGNAGTAKLAENLPIAFTDIGGQVKAAQEHKIDLVVIGPEGPLDLGIVDLLQKVGISAFGPPRAATRIESSKVFARELMEAYGIPCPSGRVFSIYRRAVAYLIDQYIPIVVKADGLAAGKGVTVAQTKKEALEALRKIILERILGDAGNQVIIDQCLFGKEVSLIAFTDGKTIVPMVPACDYKRVRDGDRGPNTGGMGSYSPSEFLTETMVEKLTQTILIPTVKAMEAEGRPYQGVLYAGLMMTSGGPKVLEYNARFGDPETQVQIPRLKTDLVDIMLAVINGTLDQIKIEWSDEACVGVVMTSEGYPGKPKTGREITGLNDVDKDIMVFHAGTEPKDGILLTAGGRVLTVVAKGKTLIEAREKVYDNISRIHFAGCHYRKDIANER